MAEPKPSVTPNTERPKTGFNDYAERLNGRAAMVGFVAVQTLVDVTGHGVKLGAWFNNAPELLDDRTLWIFLFIVMVIKGAGPISVDRFFTAKSDA